MLLVHLPGLQSLYEMGYTVKGRVSPRELVLYIVDISKFIYCLSLFSGFGLVCLLLFARKSDVPYFLKWLMTGYEFVFTPILQRKTTLWSVFVPCKTKRRTPVRVYYHCKWNQN